MRLSKEIYEERLLQIAGAYLRMRDRRKMSHEQIPVDYFVRQYGFTQNFSKSEKLAKALSDMHIWITRERERTSWTPSADRIVSFLRVHL